MTRNGAWLAFLAALLLLAGLTAFLVTQEENPPIELFVYCASGIRKPVQEIAKDYQEKYGVTVQLQFGGSQTLYGQIEISGQGDLYIPGDDRYVNKGRARGWVKEILPVAVMKAILAVKKGNPKRVASIADLAAGKVTYAQGEPGATAVGNLVQKALEKTGQWEAVKEKTTVFKDTVNQVANDLKLGTVDAGFIWDATARQAEYRNRLEIVDLPELADAQANIAIGVLSSCSRPAAALHFARYLAAKDKGLLHFRAKGFTPVDGDVWAEVPDIKMLSGSMLSVAIDDTTREFMEREGCEVTTIYSGCGILVAMMKTDEVRPDIYFSCESGFMDKVNDLFIDREDISQNQLVILVKKGNPFGIKELKDLAKEGLRVGVGHEQQCAMGAITADTLKFAGEYGSIHKNVVTQLPTGDMLVNSMRAGSLDVAIVYVSNAAFAGNELEALPIQNIPCAIVTQPVGIGKNSGLKHITSRLIESFKTAESQERFKKYLFKWKATDGAQ